MTERSLPQLVEPPTPGSGAPLRFAVIVTVLNGERFLAQTLEALRAQTYPFFEVVVVDDGSTDRTPDIVRRFCELDDRFSLIRTPNRGITPSRNLAVAHSSAPWIAVCDGDDLWLPEKLATQAAFIQQWRGPEVLAALGTCGYLINAAGERCQSADLPLRPWQAADQARPDIYDDALDLALINSSAVFPRDLFHQVGGYRQEYTPSEDLDLWLRLQERGAVINLPQRLTLYRLHGSNHSFASYVPTQLAGARGHANARRRRQGLAEWDAASFTADWQRRPEHHAQTLRGYRQLMHFNAARVQLYNRQYLPAARSLVQAVLVAPRRTVRLVLGSQVYRKLRGLLRAGA